MGTDVQGAALAAAVAARHAEIGRSLSDLDQRELRRASRLPGWDRLTIVCHLRYGAKASNWMTEDTLGTRPTSFYPLGRDQQRAMSLVPDSGESVTAVVTSLDEECRRLDELWQSIDDHRWQLAIDEPDDNPDLGSINLWTLAILRLTEVEAHGYDLDLDLSPWSDTFVSAALPMRLRWLTTRRSNHRAADQTVDGSWAIINTDGPSFLVRAQGEAVEVLEGASGSDADVAIVGTGSQLLAFILGRLALSDLEIRGDHDLAHAFQVAFPGP